MQIILGSTSRYRRELLERLRLPFECLAPQVDEEPYKNSGASPDSIASVLAIAKAESLAGLRPHAAIIGSDQVVDCDGEVIGKPGSIEAAIEQLERLSGREHRLITAVAVWCGYHTQLHVDSTLLVMRELSRSEIERYVERDQPLDCAGAYKIESLGITLFDAIESSDQTAIVGLPLIATTRMLRQLGRDLP
jgi:septum formation protein